MTHSVTPKAGTSRRVPQAHSGAKASASPPNPGFVASADAVCTKADAQTRHLTATISIGKEYPDYWERLLAIIRERDLALEGLSPPGSAQSQYAKLMRLEASEYRHDVESEKATLEHDTAAEARADKETTLPEERSRIYIELGLLVCNRAKI